VNFFLQPTNLFLIALALVSGGLLLWPLLRRGVGGPGVNTLAATQLMNHKNALVLDVREPDEFATGRIGNARNIPLAQLAGRVGELNAFKAKPVIVVCASGARSPKAVSLLRAQGFTEVVNLLGGIAAWRQAGLPVAKA
jgi:rhodanese-related sulfurtransferase